MLLVCEKMKRVEQASRDAKEQCHAISKELQLGKNVLKDSFTGTFLVYSIQLLSSISPNGENGKELKKWATFFNFGCDLTTA